MPTQLSRSFTYWYAPPINGGHQFADQFLGRVQELGEFTTVEQFWSLYCHLIRPSNLQMNSSFYVFRTGVTPLWEDPTNQAGGRLLARVPKALSSRCWENLLLALIGEQLSATFSEEDTNFICGIEVTTKKAHDVLSVWHSEDSKRMTHALREAAQRALALPVMLQWEYRKNAESVHSSHGGGASMPVGSPPSFGSPVQSPTGHHHHHQDQHHQQHHHHHHPRQQINFS